MFRTLTIIPLFLISASPMTYAAAGRQYVSIASRKVQPGPSVILFPARGMLDDSRSMGGHD